MRFTVLGSGGCTAIPRAACSCPVCTQARKKGIPYARFGCALFLEDIHLLIDTPEDINHSLNHWDIKAVDYVLYSHWHPDHTMGMRIFEQLRLNWCNDSVGIKNEDPIQVYGLPHVIEDIRAIRNKFGPYMYNYEKNHHLIRLQPVDREFVIGDIKITLIPVSNQISTVFVFEQKGEKVIYAPCNVKPFPDDPLFHNADVLIIGDTIPSEVVKNHFVIEKDNKMRKYMFMMEEIEAIKKQYGIRRVIITHLEEDWGFSYDDYLEKEKEYENITFAYDGMNIDLTD